MQSQLLERINTTQDRQYNVNLLIVSQGKHNEAVINQSSSCYIYIWYFKLTAYVNCQTDRGAVRQTIELTKDILLKENPTQSIMPVTVAIRHKNDQYEDMQD